MIARFPSNRKIPMHRGYKEIIRVHMGLVVPEGDIGFGVSDQTTKWENGKCLAFSDFSTHYAWNNTEQDRINLIIDLDRSKVIGSR
jgi:beta-hydroxylase